MTSEIVISSRDCSRYQFGAALAAWQDQLLIGAPYRYYAARQSEGIPPPTTALFALDAGNWSRKQLLTADVPVAAEGFGRTVALGNAFAIVGAPGYENGDGPVHAFVRAADGTFRLGTKRDPPGHSPLVASFAEYGASIACNGRWLIVGTPLGAGGGQGEHSDETSGVVYVFDRDSRQPATALYGSEPQEGFGSAVAVAGDRLVVGAAGSFSNERLAGAAYVFSCDASGRWSRTCRIGGRDPGEEFGAAVTIDGPLMAVAAPGRIDLDQPVGGRVDLFSLSDAGCKQIATIEESPSFGRALALMGDRLAIGQPQYDGPDGKAQAGRVGLFRVGEGGAVARQRWLAARQAGEYARLGSAVALGPGYVAAGAPGLGEDDDGSGFVIVGTF